MELGYKSNVMSSGSKLPNTNYNTNTFFLSYLWSQKKKKNYHYYYARGKMSQNKQMRFSSLDAT